MAYARKELGMAFRDPEVRRSYARRYYAKHRQQILARRQARKATRSKGELERDEEQRRKRNVRTGARISQRNVSRRYGRRAETARVGNAQAAYPITGVIPRQRELASGGTASVTGRASTRRAGSATAHGTPPIGNLSYSQDALGTH